MILLGTIVNALAIVAGSLSGTFLKKSFPLRFREIIFQGLGLSTMLIGITMALKVQNPIIVIFSLLLGGIAGELCRLEEWFDRLGDFLKARLKSENGHFTEGMVSASLIFCVGSMAIIGSIDSGVRNDHTILFTKSLLDGFASIALAATYGGGVLFSALAILIYQGAITLLAKTVQPYFTPLLLNQLTSTGGLLVIGISLNLLQIKKIKTVNLMPALVVVVILTLIFKV